MATSAEIEEFMIGPLVTWLKSCLCCPDKLQTYDDLTDGVLIHEVYLLIDPEPVHHGVAPSSRNSQVRVRNMSCIIKNIKSLYEEELCQSIISLPDCVRLGQKPESKEGLEDMRLLLLLLLGCAVQCPNKLTFIERIKSLPVQCQHTLVPCIQQVTESQKIVISTDNSELLPTDLLLKHIKRILKERDDYFQLWLSTSEEKRLSLSANAPNTEGHSNESQCQHLAGEISDWKTKLRKQRQELEEKSEALAEAKEELERCHITISKLKSEMQELKQEARLGKTYRDEVDAFRDKAERCDRLESEVIKYREKLGDLDYYKGRIEELRLENRVLEETKEMIEEQLAKTRKRADYTVQLESELLQLRRKLDDITVERDDIQERLQLLLEENTQLQLQTKTKLINENKREHSFFSNNLGFGDNLSDQMSSSAQSRILKLELENKRLTSTIETLQDNAFLHSNECVLELEKEKKKLSLMVENLEECKKRNSQQITELEADLKEMQSQLRRIQESYQKLQEQWEVRCHDAEFSNKEKMRLREQITEMSNEIYNLKQAADNSEISGLQTKLIAMEKESIKLKRVAEDSNTNLDKLSAQNESLEKQIEQLLVKIEDLNWQLFKLYETEKDAQELQKQRKINEETIANLENDLVAEKLRTQQLKNSFDALGLAIDNITDPDKVLDRIASNPEVLKAVRERLDQEQSTDTTSNAKLQVSIITLQSQVKSLTSQHTALQLANSQLVAEKEEALKELNKLKSDREKLQISYDQLNTDYDAMNREREMLKNTLKDVRAEKRNLSDKQIQLKAICKSLEVDKENWEKDSQSLVNLRNEHSKLKDDFRSLFQANGNLKTEYRNVQEEYKKVRSEALKLKLSVAGIQEELVSKNDKITALELEIAKFCNKCELLAHANTALDDDRRNLMEHVSQLLSQHHDLLTHALEDKEYYHNEEKIYVDKLNDMLRQKEKLEEKIMESYKRLDNSSTKKKSLGASIVRRMKKAGSDFINKNRKSMHEESIDRHATDSDTSNEDVHLKEAAPVSDVNDHFSCLSTPGTRKTVYLSGSETVDAEDQVSINGREECCKNSPNDCATTSYQDQRPPLFVYNRVTAKMGSNVTPSPSPTPSRQSNKDSQSVENKDSVWYEYGCV